MVGRGADKAQRKRQPKIAEAEKAARAKKMAEEKQRKKNVAKQTFLQSNSSTPFLILVLTIAVTALFIYRQSSFKPQGTAMKLNRVEMNNTDVAYAKKENDEHPLPCALKSHPTPMIIMSLGRSGTASMYQVLSKLSGGKSPHLSEYTGGSTEKSEQFFREIIPADDITGNWLIQFMCDEQRRHPTAGLVGFKWKPYETILTEDKAKQGLTLLSRLKEPQIQVIRSRRNLLDVMISRHKHSLSKKGHETDHVKKIDAHCQKDDEDCITQQLKVGTGITLPTRRLVKQLTELDDMEDKVDDLLNQLNVPTIRVSFERLFLAGNDVTEWKRIFRYLGVGPTANLTSGDVEAAGHAATSIPFHNITLSNYDEVKGILNGTQFASLLH